MEAYFLALFRSVHVWLSASMTTQDRRDPLLKPSPPRSAIEPTMPHSSGVPLAYRVNDFCKAVGVGRSTVYKLIDTGQLHTVLIGGRRLIPADEAKRLMQKGTDHARA